MNRWLFKTDPETYSWSDLVRAKCDVWDGVANNLALKYLRTVRAGDEIFIYHSGKDKAVIGIAKAASDAYSDSSDKTGKLSVVKIEPIKPLPKSVPLSVIKSSQKLSSWQVVTMSRLSVMPASTLQWKEILKLATQ